MGRHYTILGGLLMPKKVAVLMDGSFVLKKMESAMVKRSSSITSEELYSFALSSIKSEEEVFRMFFYHCSPYEGTARHPITHQDIDYKESPVAKYNRDLLLKLSQKDYIAIRKGHLAFRGWSISKFAQEHMITQQQTASASQQAPAAQLYINDLKPNFDQKEVDIKIGLDVAWLATKHIVDKIVLITGDTDLVPAMKFARREGVQVVIVNIKNGPRDYLSLPLKEHADEVRTLEYVPSGTLWKIN
jgi:uncharacterized LabA/DUF88 family protein